MISHPGSMPAISRRATLAGCAMALWHAWLCPPRVRADSTPEIGREVIATMRFERGLGPPLTLGMARVVLRPGASAWASIPGGVRMISVESGLLGVAVGASASDPLTSGDLAVAAEPPRSDDELLVPAGTTLTFGARGIASVRNPGSRSAVLLDSVVFREEPRPLVRAFTTTAGVSFQLLASASADKAPAGALIVALEALRLPGRASLPLDLSAGLTLMYVEAGTLDLSAQEGKVSSARAAASAPYAMPGALQALTAPKTRGVTAGGVIFLQVGAAARVRNAGERTAELLILTVRESF